ncbi:2'-5' RNA ligase family protein [Streptacidiphilus griseoplanus]|uniref:2'-5' RNA ligase family protein n=1 Tax=Peterkaempfera griseoplana TaxID=66896 RepID=UPI0006E24EAA|nr:2'-5' RNA ligase family protein [Peterkaempfera griseoplana]
MVALYPPRDVAEDLVVDGGLPPEELHVTVAYCGDAADVDAEALRAVVAALADRPPLQASVSGVARFTGDEQDVLVALVDSPDLEQLRRDVLDALTATGIEVPRDHGFTAHCTLTYLAPDEPAPLDRLPSRPVRFDALSTVHGTDRIDHRLDDPAQTLQAVAREAYAAGWAASGGPMTDRVRAGCEVAIQLAIENAEDPDVLKATVDLGRLEGMWALLFTRREEQQTRHIRAVGTAWRPLIHRDHLGTGIRTFRQMVGLTEAEHSDADTRAAALAAAHAMLQAIAGQPGWDDLRAALQKAIRAGRAEGMVNAVAIAADRATVHTLALDWDMAFQHAYDSLERLDELWAEADGWLARMIDRAAADLGRVLAQHAAAGSDWDEMLQAAMDAIGSDDPQAVAFVVDWAMTAAADAGALALYAAEGVQRIDCITAGDGRVCPACVDAETGSPWIALEVPRLPLHPACRCCYAADVDLSRFAAWFT